MRKLTLFLILFLVSSLWSATYYIDAVDGNDSNPGTTGEPWQTIERAILSQSYAQEIKVAYGDTVIIRDGSYGDFTDQRPKDADGEYRYYNGDMNEPLSEETLWVTYIAEEGASPVFTNIDLGADYYENTWLLTYVFDGLTIGPSNTNIAVDNGVGIKFRNLTMTGTALNSGYGFYLDNVDDIEVNDCTIHFNKRAVHIVGYNVLVTGNEVYNIGEDLIHCTGTAFTIENNYPHSECLYYRLLGVIKNGLGQWKTYCGQKSPIY